MGGRARSGPSHGAVSCVATDSLGINSEWHIPGLEGDSLQGVPCTGPLGPALQLNTGVEGDAAEAVVVDSVLRGVLPGTLRNLQDAHCNGSRQSTLLWLRVFLYGLANF